MGYLFDSYSQMAQRYPYGQMPQIQQQVPQGGNFQGGSIQIQNGGFLSVPSEDVARGYPVAPGNSITFKNENAPYIYTKTMGFSQLDRPIFEKFRLVREEDAPAREEAAEEVKEDPRYTKLIEEMEALKKDVALLKESQIREEADSE